MRPVSILSAFILLILLVAACTPETESVPMVNGAVDDFEDGDRRNLLSYEWEAVFGTGGETNAVFVVEPGGAGSASSYKLTVGGSRPSGASGDQVSGILTRLANTGDVRTEPAVDVTSYDGLEISLKGTPGSYIVQLGTAAVDDFDHYNAYVEVLEHWTTFRLPFDSFNQEGFGKARTWTGEDVTHIAVYSNMIGPYTLSVDNVRFYRTAAEEQPDRRE